MERWKPVVGWADQYEVSDLGRVRSVPREVHRPGSPKGDVARFSGKVLRPMRCNKKGHLRVCLPREGSRKFVLVHRLVLEAFVGPCPEGRVSLHWNDVASDNRLSNLRWGTRRENYIDWQRTSGTRT